jgi:hypothetical protein
MSFRPNIGSVAPVLLAIVLGACRTSPPATARAAAGRADPASCQTSAMCARGMTCALGYCVNPTPTANRFTACSLDLDCPLGDHCSLRACTHDCVSDRDCAASEICDVRGRCLPPASAGSAPAVTSALVAVPAFGVDPPSLSLPANGGVASLTIHNTASVDAAFRLLASASWFDATPATGTISAGGSITIEVRSSGDTMGASQGALSVVSAGGTTIVPVAVPTRLSGLYRGQVQLKSPEPLESLALALHLEQDDAGHLAGVVDGADSPAFPFRAALSADSSVDGQHVTLAFLIPSLRNTPANPDYPQDLIRRVQIDGTVATSGGLSGTYTETIEGVFDAPAPLSGTVSLAFVPSTAPAPTAEVATTISVSRAAAPTFGACPTCPKGPCSGNPLTDGLAFLKAATPFLDGGATIQSHVPDAYGALSNCADQPSSCLDHVQLQCAQAKFFEAMQAGTPVIAECTTAIGQADCATRGMLDSFKALLMVQSVIGNEWMARAQEAMNESLAEQEQSFGRASVALQSGYESEPAGQYRLRGLLDPYLAGWVARLPATSFSGTQLSLLSEGLSVDGVSAPHFVAAFADFDRLAKVIETRLDAEREDLQVRHRQGLVPARDLVLLGSRALVSAHLELGIAASLAAHVGAGGRLTAAVASANRLASEVERIAQGFNPAGYQDDTIAYTYNPALGATSNNFKSQLDHFRMQTLTVAKASYTDALAATRSFESDQHALATEIATYDDKFGTTLAQLCGGSAAAPNFEHCGVKEGQVFAARQDIQAAALKGEDAALAVQNAFTSIQIEQDRAAQIADLHDNTAHMIEADGTRLDVLSDQEQRIADAACEANAFMGAFTAAFGPDPNPVAAVTSVLGGLVSQAGADLREQIEKEKSDIATKEKARVEFNAANEALIDSAARIKTALLDIPKQRINVALAQIDLVQALGRLRSLLEQAQDAHDTQTRFAKLTGTDPRRDPTFRLYRDHRVADAQRDFDAAQAELFIVTRSLEYELNYTIAARARLFARSSPLELETDAGALEASYDDFVASIGPSQPRANTISLRDQIYKFANPIQDAATQQVYSPQDLFQRLLADPSNRDAKGNLKLTFSLSLAPDSTLFSSSLCNDRLTGLRATFVGAALGVTQPEILIRQKGTGYLRSCRDGSATGDYVIHDYGLDASALGRRTAVIQTGVNLSGPNDINGPPPNTELYGRPVAATYELVIDGRSPANASLALLSIDDIVLFVSHETRTVQ